MPDPATTKRVLARLAQRPVDRIADAAGFGADPGYRTVIETAESATQQLDDAAAFAEAGGLARLEAAIERAAEAGDHAAARRGRQARETIDAFRAAATGTGRQGVTADHFHSGRGTPLGGGAEAGSK